MKIDQGKCVKRMKILTHKFSSLFISLNKENVLFRCLISPCHVLFYKVCLCQNIMMQNHTIGREKEERSRWSRERLLMKH